VSEQSYETSGGVPAGPRAGFWKRFAAYVVDSVVLAVPYLVLYAILGESVAVGLFLVGFIVYFTYFEGSATGQTLGKRALGIRVIDLRTGGAIGYGRAFIRLIGRIVSGLPIYLGYLWMLWDDEKQTWHDKFANAIVVPTSAYPVS
jgi:uncharacterized RDD family membrane protein YckC